MLYLPDIELCFEPTWGKTVFFRSHIVEHVVLPAERDRMSITGWLKSADLYNCGTTFQQLC